MSVTILAFGLMSMFSLKYPLAFPSLLLMGLVIGLVYAIDRIIKDREKASTSTGF